MTTDLDPLKIPAFMRKKSFVKQATSNRLLLTAYDREKAGELKKMEKKIAKKQQKFVLAVTMPKKPQPKKKIKRAVIKPSVATFAPPMVESSPAVTAKRKPAGVITHYYDRIHVGVIKLSAPLSVGDELEIENESGSFAQTVDSLEINRSPVFTAKKGSEVGLKLTEKPKIGGKAFRL